MELRHFRDVSDFSPQIDLNPQIIAATKLLSNLVNLDRVFLISVVCPLHNINNKSTLS